MNTNSRGKKISKPKPAPPKEDRFRPFLAYLSAQVGGFNASPPESAGRIPSEIEKDDYKLACFMHSEISRDARRPLNQEILELKAEVYDLKKSLRIANEDREKVNKENTKLEEKLTHRIYRKDAEKDAGAYPLYFTEAELALVAGTFESWEGPKEQKKLAQSISDQAYEIIDELQDENNQR